VLVAAVWMLGLRRRRDTRSGHDVGRRAGTVRGLLVRAGFLVG
jgi:hypothetical protein